MKNLAFLFFLPFLLFISCSKDEDSKTENLLASTKWSQTINDNTYWFEFSDKGCFYAVGTKGTDPYNLLRKNYHYESDGNSNVTVYEFDGTSPQKVIVFSGRVTDTKLFLSNAEVTLELTKYQ